MPRKTGEMSDQKLLKQIDRAIRDKKTTAGQLDRLLAKRETLLKKISPGPRNDDAEAGKSELERVTGLNDAEWEVVHRLEAEALARAKAQPKQNETVKEVAKPTPPAQKLSPLPSPLPLPLEETIDDLRRLFEKLKAQGFDPIAVLEHVQIIPKAQAIIHPKADVGS
jgi:hypothetical protein